MAPLSVFIASTTGALRPYRDAAVHVCGKQKLIARYMEEFLPDSQPSIELCRREIDEADVFLMILAHRYGSRPVGETKSFTELEYEYAVERGLRIIPFMIEDGFPWPDEDRDHDPVDQEAMARFRQRVNQSHTSRRFGDLPSFREDLLILFGQIRTQAPPDVVRRSPQTEPFPFLGEPYRDPYQLATAIATMDDWSLVREAFGGDNRARLINWLRDDVGDTTFQPRLISRPISDVAADERILGFLAHFAPDLPPTYQGMATDTSGLAQVCASAAAGNTEHQAFVARVTEPMFLAWSSHKCFARHAGCGDGGCKILAAAWPVYRSGWATLSTEANAVAALAQSRIGLLESILRPAGTDGDGALVPAVAARLRACVLRGVVDPEYRSDVCRRFDGLPEAPVQWWQALRARAAVGNEEARFVFCLLATELAAGARAIAEQVEAETQAAVAAAERREREAAEAQARAEAAKAEEAAAAAAAEQARLAKEREQAEREARIEAERQRQAAKARAEADRRAKVERLARIDLIWSWTALLTNALLVDIHLWAVTAGLWGGARGHTVALIAGAAAVLSGLAIAALFLLDGKDYDNVASRVGVAVGVAVAAAAVYIWVRYFDLVTDHLVWLVLGFFALPVGLLALLAVIADGENWVRHWISAVQGTLLAGVPVAFIVAGLVAGGPGRLEPLLWFGPVLVAAAAGTLLSRTRRVGFLGVLVGIGLIYSELALALRFGDLFVEQWIWISSTAAVWIGVASGVFYAVRPRTESTTATDAPVTAAPDTPSPDEWRHSPPAVPVPAPHVPAPHIPAPHVPVPPVPVPPARPAAPRLPGGDQGHR